MPRKINLNQPEIAQKAMTIFWKNGFKGVDYDTLANELGVSTSTIYNKLGKEELFVEGLRMYVRTFSDPALSEIRDSEKGIEVLRGTLFKLIDALLDGTFSRSCFVVNAIMEVRNEIDEVNVVYDEWLSLARGSYKAALHRAFALGEIKDESKIPDYIEFLMSTVFALSILYKVKSRKELRAFIDGQLTLIV